MKKKKSVFLESYFDFDALFPQEYFELCLQETAKGHWLVYYTIDEGETAYGPYEEQELAARLTLAPFYFEKIVFIYHLVENKDRELKNLGVRLLKNLL